MEVNVTSARTSVCASLVHEMSFQTEGETDFLLPSSRAIQTFITLSATLSYSTPHCSAF